VQDKLPKQQLLKEEKQKTLTTGQPPGKTKTELLIKYQRQEWILEK
jgi:hypothetical protein